MTAGAESDPDDPRAEAVGRVRQVTLPSAARALSTLSRVDYDDAFLVETGPAQDRAGSLPPSYDWRTASHPHCGPESRPATDRKVVWDLLEQANCPERPRQP